MYIAEKQYKDEIKYKYVSLKFELQYSDELY